MFGADIALEADDAVIALAVVDVLAVVVLDDFRSVVVSAMAVACSSSLIS